MVSITVTVAATLIALLVAILAGYPLARFRLRGARILLLVLLATMLIPPIALAIPILFLVTDLGIRDSIVGLVLVNAAFWSPILIWLVRGAFIGVPRSWSERHVSTAARGSARSSGSAFRPLRR